MNTILNALHCNPIVVNESELYDLISAILMIIILFVNTYMDNPTSPEAIKSNKYLNQLLADKKNEKVSNDNNKESNDTTKEEN